MIKVNGIIPDTIRYKGNNLKFVCFSGSKIWEHAHKYVNGKCPICGATVSSVYYLPDISGETEEILMSAVVESDKFTDLTNGNVSVLNGQVVFCNGTSIEPFDLYGATHIARFGSYSYIIAEGTLYVIYNDETNITNCVVFDSENWTDVNTAFGIRNKELYRIPKLECVDNSVIYEKLLKYSFLLANGGKLYKHHPSLTLCSTMTGWTHITFGNTHVSTGVGDHDYVCYGICNKKLYRMNTDVSWTLVNSNNWTHLIGDFTINRNEGYDGDTECPVGIANGILYYLNSVTAIVLDDSAVYQDLFGDKGLYTRTSQSAGRFPLYAIRDGVFGKITGTTSSITFTPLTENRSFKKIGGSSSGFYLYA